ncbi:MAG: gamma-glutamyltransferase [Nevskia sp.]|nr:gamma-glutamyltransferase [Nevskia sp.]
MRRLLALVAVCLLAPAALAGAPPPGFAVASAHPLATDAGIEVLQAGGNAFDAAVAVTAALAVVEPYSSGIGGGGLWLLHRAADGRQTLVDGREKAPQAASATMYQDAQGHAIADLSRDGAIAGAIPGEPAALDYMASRYGRLGLARDLAPAIRIAEQGFSLDERFARSLQFEPQRLSPAARALLMPAGKPLAQGDVLRQPDLAQTLRLLSQQGRRGFYEGEEARRLVDGVRAGGGIWTLQDLAAYRVVERRPIVFHFRGNRIVTAPPPSAGGVGLAEILQQLETRPWPGKDRLHADHEVIEAMRRAYRDRAAYLGDPDYVKMPLQRLLSPQYARALAASTLADQATASQSLPPPPADPARSPHEGPETTHFSILDAQGNRVSATVTVNLIFGSGFMAPGTGVFVNDEMDDFAASLADSNAFGLVGSAANLVAPGKRPLSSMTPSFVEGPRGVLLVGTPGGSRIITMVTLGILRFLGGADARTIVAAPRFHMQYLPDRVEFEDGAFDSAEQAGLAAMGYSLQRAGRPYGNMQAVVWNPLRNTLEAAADPRGVGTGRVVFAGQGAAAAHTQRPGSASARRRQVQGR